MSDYLFVTRREYQPERIGRLRSQRWSCSKAAQPNDRALVYVAGEGIAYEWVIAGNPTPHPKWRFMCPVRLVEEIAPPITIIELREAFPRYEWAAPHTNLRGFKSVLLPAKVASIIRSLPRPSQTALDEIEAQFAKQVTESRADSASKRRERLANAPRLPQGIEVTTTAFIRNPDVAAEVLERARGQCEACGKAAPFLRATDATPYLEVHHKVRLADGGADTVNNAIALCRNCHRRAHYGFSKLA